MLQYLFKRILIFIPTFFIISLLIFGLSKMAPGDPVDVALRGSSGANGAESSDLLKGEEDYRRKAAQLGLDRPVFYLGLSSQAYPKDLYKINKQTHRDLVSRLINLYGNSEGAFAYYEALRAFEIKLADSKVSEANELRRTDARYNLGKLMLEYEHEPIRFYLDTLKVVLSSSDAGFAESSASLKVLDAAYETMRSGATLYKLYVPTLHWHGMNNQYHTWMFGDYPWSGLDSTPYKDVEKMYEERKALNLELDGLREKLNPVKRDLAYWQSLQAAKAEKQDSVLASLQADARYEALAGGSVDSVLAALSQAAEPLQAKDQQLMASLDALSVKIKDKSGALKDYASKGLLRGDLGKSFIDGEAVSSKIGRALYWTFLMNLISIILSYIISIPLGVKSATWRLKHRNRLDNLNTAFLFILYSIPSFWLATIFIVLFTNNEYGMQWFPASGAYSMGMDKYYEADSNISALTYWLDVAHHLTLPIFCITYGSLAYLSRQMRGSMLGVMGQDYIRTARAKGLDESKVVWKHAFRNSLFPIITLFGNIFPRALSGSVAIEYIFSLPGMGVLVLSSIGSRDWPVVFAVVMFGALLTMIGNFVADILYALVDPRISYNRK